MKWIKELMRRKITKSDFLLLNDIAEQETENVFFEELQKAYSLKSGDKVEYILYLVFAFDAVNVRFVKLLNDLIICDWHKQHENIAMLLQKLKSPESVPVLFEVAQKDFPYLNYDESYALAVKCIWALGDIGNSVALEKLEVLSHSPNQIIANNAIKQIARF